MANSQVSAINSSVGSTERRDAWWIEPLITAIVLVVFGVYSMWAGLQNQNYQWGPYLSPFYSPNLHEMFPGFFASTFGAILRAVLVMSIPLGFRATCYFYRKVYYRSFFLSPPNCSVGGTTTTKYTGERAFPFILQNAHRYFFYMAVILVIFHWFHAVQAFNFSNGFGVGVGTLVILLDAIFLTLYVFSCHSFRHLLGGKIDCFSCSAFNDARHKVWEKQSLLNANHMVYAWVSLFTVGFADLYVRLVASGTITDYRLF